MGPFRKRIRRLAWVSINVTSISAVDALVFDVYLLGIWDQVNWGCIRNCANGGDDSILELVLVVSSLTAAAAAAAGFTCCSTLNFSASRVCRRCSSSFTNSMAPPTMDAWSPYTCKNHKLILKLALIWDKNVDIYIFKQRMRLTMSFQSWFRWISI